jgi:hypothetical protein
MLCDVCCVWCFPSIICFSFSFAALFRCLCLLDHSRHPPIRMGYPMPNIHGTYSVIPSQDAQGYIRWLANSTLCLDVTGGVAKRGTNLQIWGCDDTSNHINRGPGRNGNQQFAYVDQLPGTCKPPATNCPPSRPYQYGSTAAGFFCCASQAGLPGSCAGGGECCLIAGTSKACQGVAMC